MTPTRAPRTSEGTVLLLGATGRTGRRVLAELLARDVATRVIVRSADRLPEDLADHPRLTVVEADLLDLPHDELVRLLAPCHAVISCLGHTLSLRGVFGPPRDLVERAVANVLVAARAHRRPEPLRLILMSSVSVHRPGRADPRCGPIERLVLAALRAMVPPARDNQRAADLLARTVAADGAVVDGVVVRPDTLEEGGATRYEVHEALVASLFRPRTTRIANVADVLADLACDDAAWTRWRGTMPVVVDAEPKGAGAAEVRP